MFANVFLTIGIFFLIAGAFGINRLEGIIPKLLTSSLIDTMGVIVIFVGLFLKTGFSPIGIRLIIVLIFLLLTNPVINHVITKAAISEEEAKDD